MKRLVHPKYRITPSLDIYIGTLPLLIVWPNRNHIISIFQVRDLEADFGV